MDHGGQARPERRRGFLGEMRQAVRRGSAGRVNVPPPAGRAERLGLAPPGPAASQVEALSHVSAGVDSPESSRSGSVSGRL